MTRANCIRRIAEHEAARDEWLAEIEQAGGVMAYLGLTENRLDVPPPSCVSREYWGIPRW